MKRMPASGKRSSASIYAEPTMPNTSFTPCATSVSTNASDGVIFCLPTTASVLASVMVFMAIPRVGQRSPALWPCPPERARATTRPGVGPGATRYLLHHRFRCDVLVAERLGNRSARHLTEGDVEPVLEMRIGGQRLLPPLV